MHGAASLEAEAVPELVKMPPRDSTAQPWVASTIERPSRFAALDEHVVNKTACPSQVAPPSVDLRMVAASPTAHTVWSVEGSKATPRRLAFVVMLTLVHVLPS